MRLLPLTLLVIVLTTAGCFGGDDDGGDGGNTPTPPTETTPTSPTPTTPASPTPDEEGNETTTPPPKAPKDVFTESHDFQAVPEDPQNPVVTKTFPVEEGYKKLVLNVTWTATPVILQEGVSVVLAGADGAALVTCAGPAAGPAPAEIPACTGEAAISAAGDYQIQYHGSGTLQAQSTVTATA